MRTYHALVILPLLLPAWLAGQSPCGLSIDAGPDIEVCSSDQPFLNATASGVILHSAWSPATGLNNYLSLHSMISQPADRTYRLTVQAYNAGSNLLVNGDFEQGIAGFTSQYEKNSTGPGGYIIGKLGTELFPEAKPCEDHTTTSGNMMMVKVSGTANLKIWCQEVIIQPNRDYHFSAFATGLRTNNPPIIVLEINNERISSGTLGSFACSWQQVRGTWHSGNHTRANICLRVSDEDIGAQTDFALDDMGFFEVCELQDEVAVSVVPFEVALEEETILLPCGDSIRLAAIVTAPTDDLDIQWTTTGGHLVADEQSLQPLIDAPGVYTLAVGLPGVASGCHEEVSVRVEAVSAAGLMITPPEALNCRRQEVTLQALHSGDPADFSFRWSTADGRILGGGGTPQARVDAPGRYILTLTELEGGCSVSDSVEVTARKLESFTFTHQAPDCGQERGAITFGTTTGGLPPYRYSINGGASFSGVPRFADLPPGAYTLAVQDSEGCELQQSLILPAVPALHIELAPSLLAEPGKRYPLSAAVSLPDSLIESIRWSPAQGLSCDDCLRPELTATRSGIYRLEVTDVNGCRAVTEIRVEVRENTDVYIPNAFSPDQDGRNDVLVFFADEAAVEQVVEWIIFDRFGSPVFERRNFLPNDLQNGWDGTYRGRAAPAGVYVYLAVVQRADGRLERSRGEVALLR